MERKLDKKTLRWNTENGTGGQEQGKKGALLQAISRMMLPAQTDISNIVLEKGKQQISNCVYLAEDSIAHCLLLIT